MPASLVVKNGSNTRDCTSRAYAEAGVRDIHPHVFAGHEIEGDRLPGVDHRVDHPNGQGAAARHGITRIEDQVQQRGLKLGRVDVCVPEPRRRLDLDAHHLAADTASQLRHLGHQSADQHPLRAQRLAAGEGQQLVDQARTPLNGAGGSAEQLVDRGQIAASTRLPAPDPGYLRPPAAGC